MEQPLILLDKFENGVAQVTLNNPPFNLNTLESTRQLSDILDQVEADDSIRVVVLASAGTRAFCTGSDIKEFPYVSDDVIEKKLRKENETFSKFEFLSKPTIAAIDALACGGGCEITLACDIRIIAETAQMGLPEIKLGVFPGSGGLFRLPKIIGPARAMELMFRGHFISAGEAERIGLVNQVVPEGQALSAALTLAEELARQPRESIKAIKQGIRQALYSTYEENLQLTLSLSEKVFKTEDCKEGVQAFFEKRKPRFAGVPTISEK
ncbi:enoyl-CoA hydratase/isomerase family protein [Ammoniphilus resinae]|uniref:Enoyl-CoA hydratase/carnithine racemase n=1 Tax=Ammoniphilus resinae TaxID=861532 RepID=A0ABS4GQW4_9BACL|nr:enoyl-CoA hydratase-related protein [Ammoniphilus resinae]MBP1932658.1 enoyl-CoA hydratase/carnithine racemase [Ammoniphilus resinae]